METAYTKTVASHADILLSQQMLALADILDHLHQAGIRILPDGDGYRWRAGGEISHQTLSLGQCLFGAFAWLIEPTADNL